MMSKILVLILLCSSSYGFAESMLKLPAKYNVLFPRYEYYEYRKTPIRFVDFLDPLDFSKEKAISEIRVYTKAGDVMSGYFYVVYDFDYTHYPEFFNFETHYGENKVSASLVAKSKFKDNSKKLIYMNDTLTIRSKKKKFGAKGIFYEVIQSVRKGRYIKWLALFTDGKKTFVAGAFCPFDQKHRYLDFPQQISYADIKESREEIPQ